MIIRATAWSISKCIQSLLYSWTWAWADKTVTTLTAINDLMFDELKVNKVLVIAPLRVASDTWPSEVKKWDHLKEIEISVITGTVKQRTAAVNHNAFIYIVNRENIKWLVEYYEKKRSALGLRYDRH